MKSQLGHVEVKVSPANIAFYRELLTFLGWATIMDDYGMIGMRGSEGASLWFTPSEAAASNDYDAPGANHIGIQVEAQSDVDAAVTYLAGRGVKALFDTPRHRPDFGYAADQTYYQVMFESPDRVLFEVVYIGAKDQ